MTMTKSDLSELRKAIAKLTGRLPQSSNLVYLRVRLAALKRGEGLPSKRERVHSASMSVSITDERRMLLERMAKGASLSTSGLVARAIDEYAVSHGYANDVQRLAGKS